AVRSLPQWRLHRMEYDPLIRNVIARANPSRSRIAVVHLPCCDRAVVADSAVNVDYPRRTEICPREFFLTRPHQLDWTLRRFRQARGLDRSLARVLSAISGTRVGHQYPHMVFRNMKRLR